MIHNLLIIFDGSLQSRCQRFNLLFLLFYFFLPKELEVFGGIRLTVQVVLIAIVVRFQLLELTPESVDLLVHVVHLRIEVLLRLVAPRGRLLLVAEAVGHERRGHRLLDLLAVVYVVYLAVHFEHHLVDVLVKSVKLALH